jgi:hypothetical protein
VARSRALETAKRRLSAPERSRGGRRSLAQSLQAPEETLLDVVDNLLNKGVVLNGDVVLALANVDLIYLRLSVLLSAADKVLARASAAERQAAGKPRKR